MYMYLQILIAVVEHPFSLFHIAQSVPFSGCIYFMSGDHFTILSRKKVTLKKVDLRALFDDLIIGGKDDAKYDRILGLVLVQAMLHCKFNPVKFYFWVPEVKYRYVGQVVSAEGLKPDPVKAIAEYPQPQTKEYLCRFLGLIHLGEFVSNLSAVSEPLRNLLKNDMNSTG